MFQNPQVRRAIQGAVAGGVNYLRHRWWPSKGSRSSTKRLRLTAAPSYRRPGRKETHYSDNETTAVLPTGGFITCVNSVAEGTEFNQRNGRTIMGKYIQIDLLVYPPTTSNDFDQVQWALVCDKSGCGNTPFCLC